jgi:hypothetical protein
MRVDYTKYPVGCAVSSAGVIVTCPLCGVPGERRPGSKRFAMKVVHQASIGARTSEKTKRRRTVLHLDVVCKVPHGTVPR